MPVFKLCLWGKTCYVLAIDNPGMSSIQRRIAAAMEYSSLMDFLQHFETARVIAFLKEMNVGELIHDPVFLGITAALALLALFMKWRVLLATLVSVTGFVGLISYTLQQETSLTAMTDNTLIVFVIGGVAIVSVVIYLLFIKTD
jgi:hypothetical protein